VNNPSVQIVFAEKSVDLTVFVVFTTGIAKALASSGYKTKEVLPKSSIHRNWKYGP